MARCEVCGNLYDNSFEVIVAGQRPMYRCAHCAKAAAGGAPVRDRA